jgi:hypothetical protein
MPSFARGLTLVPVFLLLAGCTAVETTGSASNSPAAMTSPSASATTDITPTPMPELIVGVDSVSLGDATIMLTAGPELATLIGSLTGATASPTDFAGPYGGSGGTRYDWGSAAVSVWTEGGTAALVVRSASLGTTPVRTAGGIAVGSSRADAIAAGGTDVWDEDGDGIADYFRLDARPAPGTSSLASPGSEGVQYILLKLTGDVVSELQIPADDFSDL